MSEKWCIQHGVKHPCYKCATIDSKTMGFAVNFIVDQKRRLNSKRRCHWCNCKIYPIGQYKIKRGWKIGDIPPDDMQTKDHILPKNHPGRKNNSSATVWSCYKCNYTRGNSSFTTWQKDSK